MQQGPSAFHPPRVGSVQRSHNMYGNLLKLLGMQFLLGENPGARKTIIPLLPPKSNIAAG